MPAVDGGAGIGAAAIGALAPAGAASAFADDLILDGSSAAPHAAQSRPIAASWPTMGGRLLMLTVDRRCWPAGLGYSLPIKMTKVRAAHEIGLSPLRAPLGAK